MQHAVPFRTGQPKAAPARTFVTGDGYATALQRRKAHARTIVQAEPSRFAQPKMYARLHPMAIAANNALCFHFTALWNGRIP